MNSILLNLMLVLSVFSILVIAIQPTKNQNSSNAFLSGGNLFGTQKARGFEAVLIRVTVVCLILFFACALVLIKMSA
ncbi:preprotein translocase subunit SecG [Allofustis seminis]|uniref:preprotein translocase subunit SecG n=1 Tax=Allofustis seminis TaxID=166939 RepID=UPI000373F256|nr:preprotein translocase subunit SecG [Allofustis seminis]